MIHKQHFRDDGRIFAVSTIVRFESDRETLRVSGRGWTLIEHATFATVAPAQAREAEVMAKGPSLYSRDDVRPGLRVPVREAKWRDRPR
jgi:hypothetical protein